LGQNMHVQTKGIATALVLPSTLAIDPSRKPVLVDGKAVNEEQPIRPFYSYIYGTDTVEGLVVINTNVLHQGNPDNKFLYKDATYNPGGFDAKGDAKGVRTGLLTNATNLWAAGEKLYITSPQGLFVVDVADPLHPRLTGQYRGPFLRNP